MDWEPRTERRRTQDGSGPRWDVIRDEVLERDDDTCQRCGYERSERGREERRLEVHQTAIRESASLGSLEKMVTLCGPCHATAHPDDPAYGDRNKAAPLFPRPDAPTAASTMRSDRQHVCQRCQYVAESATELAAYSRDEQAYVVCKPCAGALLQAGFDPDSFEVAGELDVEALKARSSDAAVRPSLLASRPVRALRPPETTTERVVHDTPIRYAFNPIGFTLLFLFAAGVMLYVL